MYQASCPALREKVGNVGNRTQIHYSHEAGATRLDSDAVCRS